MDGTHAIQTIFKMTTSNTELSEQLFTALSSGDWDKLREICSPNFKVYQNGTELDLETTVGATTAVLKVTNNTFNYQNCKRYEIPGGFVEEHHAGGTLPNGSEFTLLVCCVGEVNEEGKITVLREYFDTSGLVELGAAMAAMSKEEEAK